MRKFLTIHRFLPIVIFGILTLKVIFSIVLIVKGAVADSIDGMLDLLNKSIDVVMWLITAIWFLHIYLYSIKVIGRAPMKMATFCVIGSVLVELISSMFVNLHETNCLWWMVGYSVIEIVFVFVILAELLNIYVKYRGDQKRKHYRRRHRTDATLMDSLLGRI